VTFDPQWIAKYQRRFPGFDEKIVSIYARGMSVREIVGHLRELYGVDVSPDLIGAVTDAVLDEIAAWQSRPLEPVYPLTFLDALRIKIRDEGVVRNKAAHIAHSDPERPASGMAASKPDASRCARSPRGSTGSGQTPCASCASSGCGKPKPSAHGR
jgi:hypothetical protein